MPAASPTAKKSKAKGPLLSHTGEALTRAVSFQLAFDPTREQASFFSQCSGARRFTVNHHVGRAKENLSLNSKKTLSFGRHTGEAGTVPIQRTGSSR